MTLNIEWPLRIAPRFYLEIDWHDRVKNLDANNVIIPATAEQIARLCPSEPASSEQELAQSINVFVMPNHLLAWWDRLIDYANREDEWPTMDEFFGGVRDLLLFKRLLKSETSVFRLFAGSAHNRSLGEMSQEMIATAMINLSEGPVNLVLGPVETTRSVLRIDRGEGVWSPTNAPMVAFAPQTNSMPQFILLIGQERP
jgi:hypothetical protein